MILRKYSITLIVPILATNATKAEEPVLHEIYDSQFSRATGFGIFSSEQAAHDFLDDAQKRLPELYGAYEVRPIDEATSLAQ